MTETQKKAYIIADNKLALNSGWDTNLLSLELEQLDTNKFNLELLGFTDIEINNIRFEEKNNYPDSSAIEINPDDYNMGHQCPKCGFEFNNDK